MSKINIGKTVYINRDVDTHRNVFMLKQLEELGISAERFAGIDKDFDKYSSDWQNFLNEESPDNPDYGSEKLSWGEIGCLLSHLEVVRTYSEDGLLVLEDDVDLSVANSWQFSLDELVLEFNKKENAGILQLTRYPALIPIKILQHDHSRGFFGTAAYYALPNFTKKIVDEAFVDGKWKIERLRSKWHRKTADSVMYSYGNAYSCLALSITPLFDSVILEDRDKSSNQIFGPRINKILSNNNIHLTDLT